MADHAQTRCSAPGRERRVLLVEDHPVVLRGLHAVLGDVDGIRVCAQASSHDEALRAATTHDPDVAVVPVRLGGTRSGTGLCRALLRGGCPQVIVFTAFAREIDVRLALMAGASAVIAKSAPPEVMVETILHPDPELRHVHLGDSSTLAAEHFPKGALTPREADVLELLADARTNPEIARTLRIELTTVKTHVRSVLRKLGAGSRRDLLA